MIHAAHPAYVGPVNDRAAALLVAGSHYPASDRPLFTAAYNELCRVDLSGKRVLEICCGAGELSAQLATAFPAAEVIAVDRYTAGGPRVKEAMPGLPLLRYECADALHLPQFPDASFDVIFGQASLHHLSHDLLQVAAEYSRLLKPGGRLIFIFEPLGHNMFVAAIRAARFARTAAADESNLVFWQLEEMAERFSRCDVQVFNLLGYPLKMLQGRLAQVVSHAIDQLDGFLFQARPQWVRKAANCNIIFTK